MRLKKGQILSFIFFLVIIFSYYIYPGKFKTAGGSCNQGITLLLDRLFLLICFLLNIISVVTYKNQKNLSLKISFASFIIWLFWCIAIFKESIVDFLYLFPFLIISILNVIYIAKNKS